MLLVISFTLIIILLSPTSINFSAHSVLVSCRLPLFHEQNKDLAMHLHLYAAQT